MDNEEIIKVAVIEDDKDIRAGLELLIKGSPGFQCVGTFGEYDSSIKSIPLLRPDVVLTDINLPGKNGIECVSKLKNYLPRTQFIMLTMYDDNELVFEALKEAPPAICLSVRRRRFYWNQ